MNNVIEVLENGCKCLSPKNTYFLTTTVVVYVNLYNTDTAERKNKNFLNDQSNPTRKATTHAATETTINEQFAKERPTATARPASADQIPLVE